MSEDAAISGGGRWEVSMIVVHSFKSLQETFEARASEWMLSGATITLGSVFFLNESMFYREAFEGLRAILNSQWLWGWLLFVIGTARLAVLCVNGMYYRTPHYRAMGAALCSVVWFMFFVGFVRNGSILASLMPWIFLLDAYNAKRASREAGHSEFVQRHIVKQDLQHVGNPEVPRH